MANDLNQCNFIGRLGRDPESRVFPSGDQVVNATLAVGRKWRDKNSGETMESTEWVRLTFNGKLAEIAAQYLRKGSQIFVSGQQRTREWEKDGIKHYSTEIRVDTMQMLGQRPDGGNQSNDEQRQRYASDQQQHGGYEDGRNAAHSPASRSAPAPRPAGGSGFDDMGDDIPFSDPMKRRGFHAVL